MTVSTHVLDTATGLPIARMPVVLERHDGGGWHDVAVHITDADGRISELVADEDWGIGRWRLAFDTAAHLGPDAFWPAVTVEFMVADPARHLHVPLLLSPYGYTTYRGS